MFGQNPIRKYESHRGGQELQTREIFYTLQGEGPYSGRPSVFVRLTGCNLRCHFCDTKWDDDNDKNMLIGDIMEEVERLSENGRLTKLVVLTGGEPLRQDIDLLLMFLIGILGYTVQIETAGTLWQQCLNDYDSKELTVIVSPKTPRIDPILFERADAFKYVIRAEDVQGDITGVPYTNTQSKGEFRAVPLAEPRPGAPVYLSPCDEYNDDKNAANYQRVGVLAMKHGYIAGVQLHKLLALP